MDRTQLKTLLADAFANITGEAFGSLGDYQSLTGDIGIDSLEMASLAAELQERIGVTIEVSDVTETLTVGELASLLLARLASAPARAA